MAHGGCRCSSGCANRNPDLDPKPKPIPNPSPSPNQVQLRLRDDPEDPGGYWWSPLLGGGGGGVSGGGGGDGYAVEWLPAEGALPPAWAQSSWHEPKLLAFDLVGISPGGRRRGRFHRVGAYEALEAARLRPDAP
jgi:hypothetical protein